MRPTLEAFGAGAFFTGAAFLATTGEAPYPSDPLSAYDSSPPPESLSDIVYSLTDTPIDDYQYRVLVLSIKGRCEVYV